MHPQPRVTMANSEAASRSRRDFLRASAACGAHLLLLASAAPLRAERIFAMRSRPVRAREPWGRIEEVADGIWAMISTPLDDRTTICNGGIIRGRSGVLVIETFAQPQGSSWLAGKAKELAGRWPDEVILTHFHSDHSGGIAGYVRPDGAPRLHATHTTRDLVRQQDAGRGEDPNSVRSGQLGGALAIDETHESSIDLGNRRVRLIPRRGHTQSDVSVEIDDPSIVFCGDLLWNRMFPNYVNAIPSFLSHDVRALLRTRTTTYVPGHGPVANAEDMQKYLALIDSVERAGRAAFDKGQTAAEAAKAYRVPDGIGEWMLFSPRYPETAIGAWLKELSGGAAG